MIMKPSSSKYAFALTIEQTMDNLDALKLSDYPRFLNTIQLGKNLQQFAKNQEIESFAKLAQAHPFELPFLRLEIQDAFITALSLRSDEMTKHFLQNGFSLDSIPDCLLSVCYSLEYLGPKQAPIELLTSLLQYGANPRIADEKQASTPLHLAATFGNKQFAQKLVEYGADVNAVDLNRMTPLGLAISNKKEKVSEFLRHHGGVIDYKEIK